MPLIALLSNVSQESVFFFYVQYLQHKHIGCERSSELQLKQHVQKCPGPVDRPT